MDDMLDHALCFLSGSHAVCAIRLGLELGAAGIPPAAPVAAPAQVVSECLTEPPAPVRCGRRWRCEDGILKWEEEQCTFEERMIVMEQQRNRPLPADWPEDES